MSASLTRPNSSQLYNGNAEAVWVAAAKAGYVLCFEELVRRNEARIFCVAMHLLQNQEDAEDVLQETFLKAYQHLGQFRGDSRFSSWLVSIAVNEARQKLRHRRPNEITLDEPVMTEEDLVPRDVADWGPTPEQRYGQTELQQIIFKAISHLVLPYRIVLVLCDVEDFSREKTAQLLGLSVSAVKSRLLRARLKLRASLDPYFRQSSPDCAVA